MTSSSSNAYAMLTRLMVTGTATGRLELLILLDFFILFYFFCDDLWSMESKHLYCVRVKFLK